MAYVAETAFTHSILIIITLLHVPNIVHGKGDDRTPPEDHSVLRVNPQDEKQLNVLKELDKDERVR